jgi:hypothetical protein
VYVNTNQRNFAVISQMVSPNDSRILDLMEAKEKLLEQAQ